MRNPQIGDIVALESGLLFGERRRREGEVTVVADDGMITATFPQPPYSPMTVTTDAEYFTVVRTAESAAKVLDAIAFILETATDGSLRDALRSVMRKSGFGRAGRDLALGDGSSEEPAPDTRPYVAGSAAASTDRVHLVHEHSVVTQCCGTPIIQLPSGERWTADRSLVNCAPNVGGE